MAKFSWQQANALFKQLMGNLAALRQQDASQINEMMGLDIGSQSLKLLRIDTTTSPARITNFATAPLPVNAIIKDEIKDIEVVSHALEGMIDALGLKTKNVAIAIPRSMAIIKNVPISNNLTPDEIESRAWLEASRHFPDLVGDIYIDFMVEASNTPKRRKDDVTQLELVIIACKKNQVQPYLQVVENAGLIPAIVDVNCYALERALSLLVTATKKHKTIALLNLNAHLSSIVIIHNGKMIHSHDETFDGQHLLDEASSYLRENGIGKDLVQDDVYNSILHNNLISHLRHIVEFIYSSQSDLNIELLVISGDCASIPKLAEFTTREINTPTIIADPFSNLAIGENVNPIALRENAASLMLCTGLALSMATGNKTNSLSEPKK